MDSFQETVMFLFWVGVWQFITAGGCFFHLLCPVYKDLQLEGVWKMGLTFMCLGFPMVALYGIIRCWFWNALKRELGTSYIIFIVVFLAYILQLIYIWSIMDWITITDDTSQIANDLKREFHAMKAIYNKIIPLTNVCVPILGIIYTFWYFSQFLQIRDRINRILHDFFSRFRGYYGAYQYSIDNIPTKRADDLQLVSSSV